MQHHQHQPTTVVAILGAGTVVENALAQLLEGEGYATRVLKPFPMREALDGEKDMPVGGGVDLVVLAPILSTSECDAFLAARRRRASLHRTTPSASLPIPVIMLCSPMKEAPALLEEEEEAVRSVLWPTSRERLVDEIEDVLHLHRAGALHRTQSERATARVKMGYADDTP